MSNLSWLRRNLFVPLIARRDGVDYGRLRRELARELEIVEDPERCEALQIERCASILNDVYAHSPFYRKHFDCHGFEPRMFRDLRDLRRVPVFEKSAIPGNQENIRGSAVPNGDLIDSATGGTTGNSFAFWYDRECWTKREIMTDLVNERLSWRVGDPAAVVWNAHHDLPGEEGLKSRLRNWLTHNMVILDAVQIDEAKLAVWYETMLRRKTEILYGYAQSVREIGAYLEATDRSLPDLRLIVTTAEPLYSADRELLERVTGCDVRDRYASREHGPMAQENDQGKMEIFANSIIVEIDGEPGSTGDILVTDLWNRAFPFIRYRIGDTASIEDNPAGGLPILGPLAGRQTDFLVAEDGTRVSGMTFHEVYFDPVREGFGSDHFTTVQFAQVQPLEIEIRIVPGPDFDREADEVRMNQLVRKILGSSISVRFQYFDEIPRSASGKFRFTINEMN